MAETALLEETRGTARANRRGGRLPTSWICLAAAVICSGTYLLILQSHLTFFGDDWEFLLDRRGSSVGDFLDPHHDHIALAPVAIYKALLALFGMSSALPFQVVSTFVFLLSAALLFVYLRRRVDDWLALLGTVLILFLGAAWSDLLWSFQMGFTGSVAAGIGALLALERDDRKGDVAACALLVVATSFSELGVPFTIGALVGIALGPAPRRGRIYVALVPLALYGLWFLGWGHTGSRSTSFHNFVNSPGFIFDSISENLASLLGIAPLLSDVNSPNVSGLGWGRILLVIAIGLVAWRVWRSGRPTRWLWAVLAAGLAFWFLTALNAIPELRTSTSGRYQYPGAIFVLLIAAELLRGVRLSRRVLVAATALTIAAATSGIIFLHDGYEFRRAASDNLRARLAAVEIGRGHESRALIIPFHLFIPRPASSYFSAVDAFGSPAFSESQLVASDVEDRAAADRQLATAEGLELIAPTTAAGKGAGGSSGCRALTGPGSPGLAVRPGQYILTERKQIGAPVQLGIALRAARFADAPAVDVGLLKPGGRATLSIPADKSNRPWRLYSPLTNAVSVCHPAER